MAAKVLVVGSISGEFEKAFSKIAKLHAKTNFTFAVIVGDLFGEQISQDQLEPLLSGRLQVPLTMYFTVGHHNLPVAVQEKLESTGEICSNLQYLGRKGTLTTSDGIKIVFLGGREVQSEDALTQSIGKYDPLFLENEARVLQGAHSAHILLTNQWPTNIDRSSSVTLPENAGQEQSAVAISNLCATLKPRYHFSPSESTSWKREPFVWPMDYSDDAETQVTRFEALASVQHKSSDWISAFSLDLTKPASAEGAQRAAPFIPSANRTKRKREALEPDPYAGRRFDTSGYHRGGRGNKRHRPPYDPNDCFMCPAKPQFSVEMMVSIADESFLTSLRGPLSNKETFPQLQSTGNIMIIPMYHAADETSHGRRPKLELESEFREMTQYRHALQHMLLSRAAGQLGAVCWEVNRTGIRHFHWQWIACPQEMIGKGLVEAAFKIAAEKNDHEKFHTCDPNSVLSSRSSDFFRVWIWSAAQIESSAEVNKPNHANGKSNATTTISPIEQADALSSGQDEKSMSPTVTRETSMYFELPSDQRFNIQFGRTVMSSLLKLEHRADWRSVSAEEGDEARDAESWKKDFSEFDFAMT